LDNRNDANLKGEKMKNIPDKCKDINAVGSFCDCITDAESVDVAARGFCRQASAGSVTGVSGEDLVELKKALTDLDGK
jgi:sulfur transfer complex TusBCD TusB component (DsrH family)